MDEVVEPDDVWGVWYNLSVCGFGMFKISLSLIFTRTALYISQEIFDC